MIKQITTNEAPEKKKTGRDILREHIKSRFRKLYQEYWVDKRKTQAAFIRRMREIDSTIPVDRQQFSNWVAGKNAPGSFYRHIIVQIFKDDIPTLEDSYFTSDVWDSHEEKYRFSQSYADELEEKLKKVAKDNFKIDLTFFQGLRNIMPDFDKRFPVYAPLQFYEDSENQKPYERCVAQETAETERNGKRLFRIKQNGKTIFLSKYDMKLIKYLQTYLQSCAYSLFDKVRADLKASETAANMMFSELNPPMPPDEDILTELSDEDLQRIDPWGLYTEEERNKYHLPERGLPEAPLVRKRKTKKGKTMGGNENGQH